MNGYASFYHRHSSSVGLPYVLPCLWEVRMSPNLLGYIYGATTWQGTRLGGYRPHVFFGTGIECGMWMTAMSLTA